MLAAEGPTSKAHYEEPRNTPIPQQLSSFTCKTTHAALHNTADAMSCPAVTYLVPSPDASCVEHADGHVASRCLGCHRLWYRPQECITHIVPQVGFIHTAAAGISLQRYECLACSSRGSSTQCHVSCVSSTQRSSTQHYCPV
jgi:hypothetical protein